MHVVSNHYLDINLSANEAFIAVLATSFAFT